MAPSDLGGLGKVRSPGAYGEALSFSLVGQDWPGIVRQVTAGLSALSPSSAFDGRVGAKRQILPTRI